MKSLLLILVAANCLYGYAAYSRMDATIRVADRPAPFTPLDVPTIRLVSELPAAVEIEAPVVAATPPRSCQALGPFDDRDAVERLKSEIESVGGAATIVEGETQAPSGFLVYVGPAESAKSARVIRDRLVERNIDCHIIATGELAHALSVGVFSREELAKRQSRRVEELGFTAHVTPLHRSAPTYHLLTNSPPPEAARVASTECAAIASSERFL